ncbi:sclerostin domain-containing protein 1b [Electrophorus electricus]|uniref:sclerostin domain-containing protein 1b n=1 Tax=Electrophorus electricus TaxID=8005 RepID=UPI0015CFE15C|nr:sclerostin domain-containing protein 1b [Electrophorus electricus]
MPCNTGGYQLLLFLCVLLKNCQSVKNDATETFNASMVTSFLETPNNVSLNRARNGGRRTENRPQAEQSQVGCRELRSTKYISDGQCTSLNAVKELVCAGECLPTHLLPNWIGGGYTGRYWGRRDAQEWRCVNDRMRTQRIRLQCQDGSTRTYKITAVTSCKCKRYTRQYNDSALKFDSSTSAQPVKNPKTKKNRGKSAEV